MAAIISMRPDRLKLVTLENFHQNVLDPTAHRFFSDLCRIRVQGYSPEYPVHFLPLDTLDFISTHHILCFETSGSWVPFCAIRHVSLTTLNFYKIPLTLLSVSQEIQDSRNTRALEEFIQKHSDQKRELIYSSRFTLAKQHREKELLATVREIIAGIYYDDIQKHHSAAVVGAGVLRLQKNLRFYLDLGFEVMKDEKGTLNSFTHPRSGEELQLIAIDQISEWSKKCFEKHRSILNSRLWIQKQTERKAA